jgi:hypothetical protein
MMTLTLHRCAASALVLLALVCAGCLAPLPVESPLPPGLTMTPVAAQLLPQRPVAVSSDGDLLALVHPEGLFLRLLAGSSEQKLSDDLPVAMAFNPNGTELAAAFSTADGSRLRRYATSNGELLAEIAFSGRCEALLSREGEWLAFVTTRESFRFGGNLRSRLLRWDGVHTPSESLLNDTTLYRPTLATEEVFRSTLRPQLSPHGDEILYMRLYNPPAFASYIAVVLHHIDTKRDHLVAKLPQMSGSATYLDGGEVVAYSDGINLVKLVDPWTEGEIGRFVSPGVRLAAPATGEVLWMDNSLRRRDGQLLLSFTQTAEPVRFFPDGRLLLRDDKRLWLLRGLPPAAPVPPVSDTNKLRLLRKWRAEGLIDVREYAERVGK